MVHLGKDPIPLLVFYQQIKIETWKSDRISLKKTFLPYTTPTKDLLIQIYIFKILLILNTFEVLERGK